jgi:ABC-type transport system involved in multi-copper enzyme maturation permease subunit
VRQILTILWDSYRLLSAKKLFWVSLTLSTLIAGIYASIGFGPDGTSVLFGAFEWESETFNSQNPLMEYLYLLLFTNVVVPFWLGLFALVLALISVCSVFPDFLQNGSIDVAVSKPISRITLFVTKYLSSLLFVLIQVFVFCLIVFLAIGLRLESWNVTIFWAVPLIVFVFSLIFSVAVLMAVWTRSSLLSLLMALLVWGVSWGIQVSESLIYKAAYVAPAQGLEMDLDTGETEQTGEPKEANPDLAQLHRAIKMVEIPLPKTRDAVYLLKKKITINGRNLTQTTRFMDAEADDFDQSVSAADEAYQNRHSELYIIGTSLAFELVVLSLACFSFVRKDY